VAGCLSRRTLTVVTSISLVIAASTLGTAGHPNSERRATGGYGSRFWHLSSLPRTKLSPATIFGSTCAAPLWPHSQLIWGRVPTGSPTRAHLAVHGLRVKRLSNGAGTLKVWIRAMFGINRSHGAVPVARFSTTIDARVIRGRPGRSVPFTLVLDPNLVGDAFGYSAKKPGLGSSVFAEMHLSRRHPRITKRWTVDCPRIWQPGSAEGLYVGFLGGTVTTGQLQLSWSGTPFRPVSRATRLILVPPGWTQPH
jgi:hypothetical protein